MWFSKGHGRNRGQQLKSVGCRLFHLEKESNQYSLCLHTRNEAEEGHEEEEQEEEEEGSPEVS